MNWVGALLESLGRRPPVRVGQTHVFENNTEADLIVDIELYPDRYVLKPGDVMELTFDQEGDYGLHTIVHDGALQIYLHHFDTAVVTINGQAVEPWAK